MAQSRPILATQRQELIVQTLRERGAVRVHELTERLGVSDMTIRRDLDALVAQDLVMKVHGGAVLKTNATSEEPTFESKSVRELAEKAAIARTAAELASPGMAVALSAGTTTWALAHELATIADLTVVTNSMRIAELLTAEATERHTVVLTGGIRTPSDALVGPVAERAIRQLHVDVLFIGCHGIDPEAGLTTPNLAESEANRHFIASAHQVVAVADHTKWGTVGLSSFGDLRDVDVLVTDDGMPAACRTVAAESVGRLLIAASRGIGRAGRA